MVRVSRVGKLPTDLKREDRSRMKILNRSGERGCPCSVPLLISTSGDRRLLILIFAVDFWYISLMTLKKFPEIFRLVILKRRRSLDTVSNAFLRSIKQV